MDVEGPVVVWLRQDLRLADHPALAAAAATGRSVVPVFVLDDITPGRWRCGGASRWWLHGSLEALAAVLAERGNALVLRQGRSEVVLAELAQQTGAAAVYWNRHLEPHWRAAEDALAARLADLGIAGSAFDTQLLFPPGTVRGRTGGTPLVFTPFWRACLAAPPPAPPLPAPPVLRPLWAAPVSETLADWRLRPERPDWAGGLAERFTPGEAAARKRLAAFIGDRIAGYGDHRDHPGLNATSRLSPYLHWGELSPRQVWHAARSHADASPAAEAGVAYFLRQLGWRDFCALTLRGAPEMPEQPLQRKFARFPWADEERLLRAWTRGCTGYPIVDAGMRELWHSGWMHNRVRMIAASFLCKHLLQPWQAGEAWFWDTLVDADLANNAGGWQWVAGCGVDAAPYFRIFNPVTQGEKFDAGGDYVRRWVPELARLDRRWIHKPWLAPPLDLAAAGVRIGDNYPAPLVDHGRARSQALAAFAAIKGSD